MGKYFILLNDNCTEDRINAPAGKISKEGPHKSSKTAFPKGARHASKSPKYKMVIRCFLISFFNIDKEMMRNIKLLNNWATICLLKSDFRKKNNDSVKEK